jgi:hypothetical protein
LAHRVPDDFKDRARQNISKFTCPRYQISPSRPGSLFNSQPFAQGKYKEVGQVKLRIFTIALASLVLASPYGGAFAQRARTRKHNVATVVRRYVFVSPDGDFTLSFPRESPSKAPPIVNSQSTYNPLLGLPSPPPNCYNAPRRHGLTLLYPALSVTQTS